MGALDAAASTDAEVWPVMRGNVLGSPVLSTSLGGGVALGTTRAGKPVSVQLLRAAPVRVVVVEQAWIASMLAVRATALGAGTVIVTARPAPWASLVGALGGDQPFAAVQSADAVTLPPAGLVEPLCVLVDGALAAQDPGTARGPWHTSVHLLYRLAAAASPLVDSADLVLVPRPQDEEIDAAVELLRLPPAIAGQIARMGADEVLAVTRGRALFVTLRATPAEQSVLRQG